MTFEPKNKGHLRITNWTENVPVRGLSGEIIGRAKISDKGEVHIAIDNPEMATETYRLLSEGSYGSLSIHPSDARMEKYSETVKIRLGQQNPFNQEGWQG